MSKILGIVFICLLALSIQAQELLRTNDARISFVSEAPLEIIKAESDNCRGLLRLSSGEFAFKVFMKSFEGFNSPLQQVHFQENYMEVKEFPESTFSGKIIETLEGDSFDRIVRAKGILNIHGVPYERIIEVKLIGDKDKMQFESEFTVALKDHDIVVPMIVQQKIAEIIKVRIEGEFE